MVDRNSIVNIVYNSLDNINPILPPDNQLAKNMDTALYSKTGHLDSMGVVNLIVELEQSIEDELEMVVDLTEGSDTSPLATVETLVDYLFLLLNEQ